MPDTTTRFNYEYDNVQEPSALIVMKITYWVILPWSNIITKNLCTRLKKKWPMGHIAHLRNQFKSMNTSEGSYDNIYYKTDPVFQEEKIFKFRESTFTILLYLPM